MNVLLVNDHLGYSGTILHGVGRLFLDWLPVFNRDRYNVKLCILKGPDPLRKLFEERGIEVKFLADGKLTPLTLLEFIRLIRREKIDVMHVQGYAGSTFGRLARMITGIPVLVHFHDTYAESPWVQNIADLLLSRYTDTAIAVSNYVKEMLISGGKIHNLNPDMIQVMHNCIPIEQFTKERRPKPVSKTTLLNVDKNTKVIGCIASLFSVKGHQYLLEAMPSIISSDANVRLVIVGDGPLRKDLEHLSETLGIRQYVTFAGFCQNVAEWLAAFDVKVVPSLGERPPIAVGEAAPIAVLEAMAMGTPIVATSVIEVIENGVTGVVVPPKDSDAIAQKVIMLLRNETLRHQLGMNAQQESQKYDVHPYVRRLENIYDDLMSRTKAGTPAHVTILSH